MNLFFLRKTSLKQSKLCIERRNYLTYSPLKFYTDKENPPESLELCVEFSMEGRGILQETTSKIRSYKRKFSIFLNKQPNYVPVCQ